MAKTQWLQCTIPMENWQRLNERRQKLGLTWSAILEPAANEYLTKLEAAPAPVTESKTTATAKSKSKKAPATKGKKQPEVKLADIGKEVVK
jgi:hypothetical protein